MTDCRIAALVLEGVGERNFSASAPDEIGLREDALFKLKMGERPGLLLRRRYANGRLTRTLTSP